MQKIICTCPFTGVEFEAMKDQIGNLHVINPLTGEKTRIAYVPLSNSYALRAEHFDHIETVTPTEAAEIIGVSKPRISALCQSGQLKNVTVGNSVIISKDSAIEYRDSERKAGRRW